MVNICDWPTEAEQSHIEPKTCTECRGTGEIPDHAGTDFPMPDLVMDFITCKTCGGSGEASGELGEGPEERDIMDDEDAVAAAWGYDGDTY